MHHGFTRKDTDLDVPILKKNCGAPGDLINLLFV